MGKARTGPARESVPASRARQPDGPFAALKALPRAPAVARASPAVAPPVDTMRDSAKRETGGAIDDDTALFRQAVRDVRPLPPHGRAARTEPKPPPRPRQSEADEQAVLQEALHGPLSVDDRLEMGVEAAFLREGLPRRVLADLRRGRWVVQEELDLHGLTREAAREALGQFMADALHRGHRCLRLIHGKGLGSPGQEPVLKHLARAWLARRDEILAFCQARPQDGGDGALLILLRAPRPLR